MGKLKFLLAWVLGAALMCPPVALGAGLDPPPGCTASRCNTNSSLGYQINGNSVVRVGNLASFWNVSTQPTAIGYGALASFPWSTTNNDFGTLAIGALALNSLTAIGTEDVAIGAYSSMKLTTGTGVTSLGLHSNGENTVASSDTYLGNDSCRNCIDGAAFGNVGVGISTYRSGAPQTSVAVGAMAERGNANAVTITGTSTQNDVLSITFTATGSTPANVSAQLPVTVSHTMGAGDSLTNAASDLASQIGALNIVGTNLKLGADNYAPPDGSGVVNITYAGIGSSTGWALNVTTGVTGAATEVMSVGGGAQPQEEVAVGFSALAGYSRTSAATRNTAVGGFSQQWVTSGADNASLGRRSLTNLTSGFQNSAVGSGTLGALQTGSQNTAEGYNASAGLLSGTNNVGVGSNSFGGSTTQGAATWTANTAVGFFAMSNPSGSNNVINNTAVGYFAMQYVSVNSAGNYNVAVGYTALQNAAFSGGRNTAVGASAGTGMTTGTGNTILGDDVLAGGACITTGGSNLEVGEGACVPGATTSNQMSIQNIIYGTGNSGTGATLSTGSVGVATSAPTATFTVGDAGGTAVKGTHVAVVQTTAPGLTSCGTSPALDATASDVAGTITEGTTSTGCTLTFTKAFATAPHCVMSSPNGAAFTSYTPSTTTLVIANASASGNKYTYACVQ